MRVTLDSLTNKEHLPYTIYNCCVRFNGEKLEKAIAADDEENWAEVYTIVNDKGCVLDNGELSTEVIYGDVEFYMQEVKEEFKAENLYNYKENDDE